MEVTQALAEVQVAFLEAWAETNLAVMEEGTLDLEAMEVTLEVTLAQEVSWHVAISLNWLMLTPLTQEVSRIK